MDITILLDADLEGKAKYLKAELVETGWDQDIVIEFKRLRDFGLSHDTPDQEVWRFVQQQRLWLLTNNRNNENEISLEATIRRENTAQSLPVITVSDKDRLDEAEYRQRAVAALVEIILYPEQNLGTGRLFIP